MFAPKSDAYLAAADINPQSVQGEESVQSLCSGIRQPFGAKSGITPCCTCVSLAKQPSQTLDSSSKILEC